ncbi:hypothetical protein EI983_11905 [Roseovarius faecimaris]|uniref:Uncharacterized protein n=1 Tax=Roseovarius faecimaris TaxID=2494550 RepID=A0A6I6IUA4_9RHOB|nr:tetratricopeptide repeat protein [Roseovarius faecimaris]QGX98936.1 hypothetical protein EI983_11905 [Roseovarius faecimaris]
MRYLTTCLCLLLSAPAAADTCPAAPDHSSALQELTRAAQSAPDEATGRQISNQMWELWLDAPDARAKELLTEGMARRESYDFEGALVAFEALVAYCPDYAEGYNQRAFVHYLRRDFAAALPDLEEALRITPGHVAALTGQALTLVELDRKAEAALVLRRALGLNPWLGERHLLPVLEAEEEEL